MVNAIVEFFAINLAWVFWLALYYTPESTPDWINLLLLMVMLICIAASLIALWEDFD
jgi:succinate dehydrogenase hydrophobic anchor subunit